MPKMYEEISSWWPEASEHLTEAGFEARAVLFEHSEVDNCTLGVFVAKRLND